MSKKEDTTAYWRANVRLLLILLVIWFSVSFGAGILLRPWLDNFSLGGYPLGFWFAQIVAMVTCRMTAAPPAEINELVERIRIPA
ncbi:DUF4212 domain-containing protein [Pacificimonas sp. WHA3]|uniref:DUF4212 domain-containing protein n=1 Tax=Pacificimonas pallii TaxID=2827236 RepID=A0ABS6SDQ3_9SPHN|nr:DUF4212 domain-containing protein [Pacificimonas pallii]MBV7255977.1 DUF4212 domain-containing protein [Pacificimonas pallii]